MDCFIGIDVAKATLDIAVLPSGETWTVSKDDAGVHELLPRLLALTPTLVVLEATGGFESATVAALAKAGMPVVVANPRLLEANCRTPEQMKLVNALCQLVEHATAGSVTG